MPHTSKISHHFFAPFGVRGHGAITSIDIITAEEFHRWRSVLKLVGFVLIGKVLDEVIAGSFVGSSFVEKSRRVAFEYRHKK